MQLQQHRFAKDGLPCSTSPAETGDARAMGSDLPQSEGAGLQQEWLDRVATLCKTRAGAKSEAELQDEFDEVIAEYLATYHTNG